MTIVGGHPSGVTAHVGVIRRTSWVGGEVYGHALARVGGGHRAAHAVDDRVVTSGARDPHAEEVVELHTRRLGRLEDLLVEQRRRALEEHDIAAPPVALAA